MKKKFLALFLAAAMVGAVAGCSQNGGSDANSGEASEASQSSGESQEPSGEVVTLHCGGWGRIDTEHEAGVIGMAEAIGINVEFQSTLQTLISGTIFQRKSRQKQRRTLLR